MVAPKYFVQPFANSGDRVTIPDTVQGSGSVSYPQGFGPDYSLNPATNPSALKVPRTGFNEAFFDITNAIQYIQQHGVSAWIASADNLGTPYTYARGDRVRFTDGNIYVSLVNGNTDTPPTANWVDDTIPTAGSVTSVFTRTGNVVAANGDYNTDQVTEGTNKYLTNARVIASTLTGFVAGAGTVSSTDDVLQAFEKVVGNLALKATVTKFSGTAAYTSGPINVEATHGLGATPDLWSVGLKCLVAEDNFGINDVIQMPGIGYAGGAGGGTNGSTTYANPTKIGFSGSNVSVNNKTTFGLFTPTTGNWQWVFEGVKFS